MLAFGPLVFCRWALRRWSGDTDRRAGSGHPPHPSRLVGGRRDLPRAARCRGVPRHPERDDRAAARGVRLVDRHDLGGAVGQPGPVRDHRAVRGRVDGALRCAAGRDDRAAHGRRRQRADGVHDGVVAARHAVGRHRRAGHRVDGDGAGRDRGRALVRRPPRARLRHPHRGERDRPADLPADDRAHRAGQRLACGLARRSASARWPSSRWCCCSCASGRPTWASSPTAEHPRTSSRRCAPGRRGWPSARCSGRPARARSGCSPAASSSAARRRRGWSSSTSCPPHTTTACRSRPLPRCSRSSASSTSWARSGRAG